METKNKQYVSGGFPSRQSSRISETGSRLSRLASKARFRWAIFFLCNFANFCGSAIASTLPITIVAMIHDEENLDPEAINGNLTQPILHHVHVNWNGVQKDRMLQASSWGVLATSIIGGRLGELFGPRRVVSIALLTAGLLNLIFPAVSLKSFWGAYIIRVVLGLVLGVTGPAYMVVVSRWSPQYEVTLSSMVAGSGYVLANIIVHPLAGILVSGSFLGGWPAMFYVFGTISLAMSFIWYFLVYDDPESHPRLSSGELEEIVRSRSLKKGVSKKIPWAKMLTSLPVYAFLITPFTYGWVVGLVSSQMPSYYEEVLGMSFQQNGYTTSLPWILGIIMSASSSAIADRIRQNSRFSTTTIRKAFTLVPLSCVSIGIFLLTLVGQNSIAAVTIVTLAKGLGTANKAGAGTIHLDICPSFAGTLTGMSGTVSSMSSLAMNEAVARIVGNEPTPEKWYKFFYLTAGLNTIGVILFCLLASGEVQEWDPSFQAVKPVEKKEAGNTNQAYSP